LRPLPPRGGSPPRAGGTVLELSEPDPAFAEAPAQRVGDAVTVAITTASRARRRAMFAGVGAAITAIAAAAVLVMAVQVSHLDGRVGKLETSLRSTGLASAVSAALVGPHHEAVLSSATSNRSAEVVITSSGEAYWVRSSLPRLGSSRTYQLWALVHGRPVSVALIGPNPSGYAAFRIGPGATALMVTAEPAGGTSLPTTGVLVQQSL
jgi:hypothetical protein